MKTLFNFLLRFLGRWFARTAPEQSQEVEKGIDAVIPDRTPGNKWRTGDLPGVEIKRRKLKIGGNPSR
jgi:hypothetical protein